MIYELRTYTLYPGKVPEFLAVFEKEALPVREKYSKPTGWWYTEMGELNQVVHLWAYKDFAHRTQVRQAVAQDPEWQQVGAKLGPLIMKMENKILTPANFSPLK
jgi:hypothetical protein